MVFWEINLVFQDPLGTWIPCPRRGLEMLENQRQIKPSNDDSVNGFSTVPDWGGEI